MIPNVPVGMFKHRKYAEGEMAADMAGERPAVHAASRSISRPVEPSAPAARPVSGLARPNASPSHDCSQWLDDASTLAYRCGGSTGIEPVSRLSWQNSTRHLEAAELYPKSGH